MNTQIWTAVVAVVVLMVPSIVVAQVPAEVPIQGYLTDDQGVPVDESVTVNFRIYDSATDGTELHAEEKTVHADAGVFTTYLTPPLSTFEENTELYLGLSLGGVELSPRLKVATAPYSAVAGNALTLEGKTAADFTPAGTAATLDSSPTFSGSVTATEFNYPTTVTRQYTMPAAEFFYMKSDSNDQIWSYGGSAYFKNDGGDGLGWVEALARVDVPHGAEVTKYECYVSDSHSTSNLNVQAYLERLQLGAGLSGSDSDLGGAVLDTTGVGSGLQAVGTTSINNGVVDENYAYWMRVSFSPSVASASLRFNGCKVSYTVDGPAP